ncbi:MAG: DUF393 domain-containing protein [Rhizobiales bacterium]|nr:DUF393 domain-containing protein [Hyphomicrobiales bacterium]
MLIVYYNTKCPVCDAGINYQQNKLIALVKSGKVEFRDINLEPDALAKFDVGLEDIRKKLYALDDNANLLVGADVALALWAITPSKFDWQKRVSAMTGNFVMLPVTRLFYNGFAILLYRWNKYKKHW